MRPEKKISIEVFRQFMKDSTRQAKRDILDPDGVFEPGEDAFVEALAEKVNRFFSGDTIEIEYVEIKIKIYNAKRIKPPVGTTKIVTGGCAFWDGANWRTLMESAKDYTSPIISWPVTWWADLPKGYEF